MFILLSDGVTTFIIRSIVDIDMIIIQNLNDDIMSASNQPWWPSSLRCCSKNSSRTAPEYPGSNLSRGIYTVEFINLKIENSSPSANPIGL